MATIEGPDTGTAVKVLPLDASARPMIRNLVLASALILTALAIQLVLGAYTSERGNYSDEAVHFMNGLLVRDYVWAGASENPVAFATRYYVNYPKIAPLMWPPLFHLILGLAMIIVPSPHIVGLLLVACATAWTAWRLFRIVEEIASVPAAFVAVVLFFSTSVVVNLTTMLMLDMVVAAFTLECAYWFARFAGHPSLRHAVMFAVMAAGACLTKGNGLAVVLIPLVFMILTGRFELLRTRGLWTAALIVAVLAGPLLAYSLSLDARIGDFAAVSSGGVLEKAALCASFLIAEVGHPVVFLAAFSSVVLAWTARRNRLNDSSRLAASMAALAISAVAIHVITPLKWVDNRYLAMAVAPLWALIMYGFSEFTRPPNGVWTRRVLAGALVVVIATFLGARPAASRRAPLGLREVTSWLKGQNHLAGHRIFIASDELGEGALVSEVATMHLSPRATVIRGSKLLARDGWSDREVDLVFASLDDLLKEFQELGVSDIVVDESAPGAVSAQVRNLVKRYPDQFRLAMTAHGTRRVAVYQLTTAGNGPRKPLRVTPSPTQRTLQSSD